MPESNTTATQQDTASRAGRRFGVGLFALVIGCVTAGFTIQVILAAYSPVVAAADQPCAKAAAQLWSALLRARRSAAEGDTESAALLAFRRELDPEWSRLPEARGICEAESAQARGLAELVSLRFREEHAVRFEARGLGIARRRVQSWVQSLDPSSASSVPAHEL